jgi:hypothetical protein
LVFKYALRNHRRRREDNIEIDREEIGWGGLSSIKPDQDRRQWWALVNTVINFLVLQDVGKFFYSKEIRGFSRTQFRGVN